MTNFYIGLAVGLAIVVVVHLYASRVISKLEQELDKLKNKL